MNGSRPAERASTRPVERGSIRPGAPELLAENVQKLLDSETYKAALRMRKRFHRYSFRNVWLIYCQNPHASHVAGYQVWKACGRQVMKGEQGIRIFAPLTKRNDAGDTELFGFKTASVFDVSQTEGEPLPETPRPEPLTDDDPRIPGLLSSLETFARGNGSAVAYQTLTGTCHGFFRPSSGDIVIGDGLPPLETLATLIHEIAHSLAHGNTTTARSVAELEAESCAFLVCDALGLDTSKSSFAYLANWTDNPEQILPAAQHAAKLSDRILEALTEPPPVLLEPHGVRVPATF